MRLGIRKGDADGDRLREKPRRLFREVRLVYMGVYNGLRELTVIQLENVSKAPHKQIRAREGKD